MRRLRLSCTRAAVLLAAGIIGAGAALAQETSSTLTSSPARPIRVLLTYGIHPFPEKEFFAMWDALPGIEYKAVKFPDEIAVLKPGIEKQYDVLVRYDQMLTTTPDQQRDFAALLEAGIGFVALHHNLCAHDDWDEYRKITGALFLREPRTIEGKDYSLSTCAEDVDVNVKIVDPAHPITRGLADFTINDEVYGNYYHSPANHVLLTTDHPGSNRAVAWVGAYGRSPVFSFQLGHAQRGYADANFRRILVQGIEWANQQRQAMAAETERARTEAQSTPGE